MTHAQKHRAFTAETAADPRADLFDRLVEAMGPDALLLSAELEILKAYGDLERYASPASGAASRHVDTFVRRPYRQELRLLCQSALADGAEKRGLRHRAVDDPKVAVQLRVTPLRPQERDAPHLLAIFERHQTTDAPPAECSGAGLAAELQETRRRLRVAVERSELAHEELQSTCEALQASNAQLQNSNQELAASNKALQSTNEELATVNDELNTAYEELRAATADLAHLLMEAPTPLVVVDETLTVVRMSKSARRFFNLPDGVEHPHAAELAGHDGAPALAHVAQTVLTSGAPYDAHCESADFAGRICARRYGSGRNGGAAVILSIIEMTEMVRSRRELQKLFDLAPVAILERDAAGTAVRRNAAMRAFVSDDRDAARAGPDVRHVRGGDAAWRWIRFIHSSVETDGLSRTYSIGADVTELIEAQGRLKEQTNLLKMSQRLGRLGHWRLDLDSGAVYWSDELYRLTGEDPSFFHPTRDNMLGFYDADARARIRDAIDRAIARREPFSLRARLTACSGVVRIVDWSGRAEVGADGAAFALIGIVRDVTAIHEREEKLERALEELGRSNAELSRFSYICSHDMREPVRTIASMVALLCDTDDESPALTNQERRQLISRIESNAARLMEIIDGLLAFSRLDGKLPIERVDLEELVRDVVLSIRPAFPGKTLEIETRDLPVVTGARVHLRQLLQNLVVNSAKFSQGATVNMRLDCVEAPHAWRLRFSDDGPGVPREHREEVFLMFRRLARKDEGGGSGLGLGISKKIIEQHGGSIICTDGALGGAGFEFTLAKGLS